jgi:hypothetical protein
MAVDPLSGTSKPLPPRDVLDSRIRRPLQFAATLLPAEELVKDAQTDTATAVPHRRRREIERVPGVPLDDMSSGMPGSVSEAKDEIARLLQEVRRLNIGTTSGDAHRHARPSGRGPMAAVGTPEWIESRIEALIFNADVTNAATAATLDLSGLGMRALGDKIAELQDMTRLAKREDVRSSVASQGAQAARLPGAAGTQFKRYTSAPVTGLSGTSRLEQASPPINARAVVPRAVSGPSTTQQASRPLRTRSALHREVSTTSTASNSDATSSWSRVPSTTSALGEGDSFASTTSTVVSDVSALSGRTLVDDNEQDWRKVDPRVASFHGAPSTSALSNFRKQHQMAPPAGSGRAFSRSSSAMIPAETTARRGMGAGKTVSFAQLGVGSSARPLPAAPPPASAPVSGRSGWSRSASGTLNRGEKGSWKGASRGDVQLILSNNMLTW